jgi:hypothetical protein
MNPMRFVPVLLFLLCIEPSCNNCRCVDVDATPNFIGFDSSDISSIVIKKFEKGSGFTKFIDSVHLTTNDFCIQMRGDTIDFPARSGDLSINPRFDWKILLPNVNRSYNITEIQSEQIRSSCPGKVGCGNPIISLKINLEIFRFGTFPYNFYLKK